MLIFSMQKEKSQLWRAVTINVVQKKLSRNGFLRLRNFNLNSNLMRAFLKKCDAIVI